jgi:hypothetical protein
LRQRAGVAGVACRLRRQPQAFEQGRRAAIIVARVRASAAAWASRHSGPSRGKPSMAASTRARNGAQASPRAKPSAPSASPSATAQPQAARKPETAITTRVSHGNCRLAASNCSTTRGTTATIRPVTTATATTASARG